MRLRAIVSLATISGHLFTASGCACGGGDGADGGPPDSGVDALDAQPEGAPDAPLPSCYPEHQEDAAFEPTPCPAGLPDGTRDLWALALDTAGLDVFDRPLAWTDKDWQLANYLPVLRDAFVLPDYAAVHAEPSIGPCMVSDLSLRLDHAAGSRHALSATITQAAARLGIELDRSETAQDAASCDAPLALAALTFARAVGGSPDEETVRGDAEQVPREVQVALAPVLLAMTEVARARQNAVDELGEDPAEDLWANAPEYGIWMESRQTQEVLLGGWRTELYQAARGLAATIDHARLALADWPAFESFSFDLETRAGRIVLRDSQSQEHSDLDPVALFFDAGGDDRYRFAAGATIEFDVPVSVAIDLGGDDTYGYEEFPSQYDGKGHRLPADAWGRLNAGSPPYCRIEEDGSQYYGPITLSREARQGAGIFGVGILVDLGQGSDTYASPTRSQGFGAAGLGALLDDGGDDSYTVESLGQGTAAFGIGLLIDLGGQDRYVSYTTSQGYAYVGGSGLLVDADGDDTYICDHGIPDESGDPIYCSPQRPGNGNSSFCQGAGFGLRGDGMGTYLAGGLGVLRDRTGNDTYEAGVFGQGTGYWEGMGILSDGSGNDRYDAIWYVQGAAAHYAVGILTDGAGDDVYNDNRWTVGVAVGSGHDYSLGMLLEESGADSYFSSGNGAGDGNCNGIGVFVDNAGDDRHESTTADSYGHAHISGECANDRAGALTGALFIDAAGDDTYTRPKSAMAPDNDTASENTSGTDSGEHGCFLDATDGDTRMHAR